MKIFGNISSLFLVITFLMSSAGIVVFESHCSCLNSNQVSLYVSPDTCEEVFHEKHQHSECSSQCCSTHHNHKQQNEENTCESCSKHMQECGCGNPEIKFFKLKNQLDEDVRYLVSTPVELELFSRDLKDLLFENRISEEEQNYYTDPPPKLKRSFELLIQIQQLKIPSLA